ncbi:flagellar motor switch protein FliG [Oxobacter pfennigii]|uniref:Flagellar motor switch protein FliG n=1 Tax=Oxobacter pfennigii TaxID=36849 RepID=A0A0N8NTF5_9CLOT|nr:flagellar motor switch protein FliG [Oxobacter pfennigii]KPU44688.1 flagellar motor switch protein FliG [Oxobacter pfennigii]
MPRGEGLTGVQKAAVLMITLGPEISSNIIKKLPDNDIQKITFEIANTVKIKSNLKDAVLEEFVNLNKAKEYILEGGMEYAKTLLSKALGAQRAMEIMEQVGEITQQFRPFGSARKADAQQLLSLISNEHPQTIALILCYIQADKAGQILSGLSPELQSDIAKRIAAMRSTSPSIVHEVEKVLERKLSSMIRPDLAAIGGVNSLVQILNQVDRGTEKSIIEYLGKDDPELAEKVRASMFVFEDILTLDNASIQRIIREIDNKDLALALKGSSEEVAEGIYRNMSKRAAATLKEDIEYLGPVRLVDVEKAQHNIVSIIRRLDESGEIIISRGGEDAVIV